MFADVSGSPEGRVASTTSLRDSQPANEEPFSSGALPIATARSAHSAPPQTAATTPFPAPAPAIVYGTDSSACSGTNLVGSQQSKIVGQLIQLIGCVTLPSPLYLASQSWTVQGPVVGGYNASATTGTSFTVPIFNQAATQFYWYYVGSSGQASYTVQYSYCMSNGVCSSFTSASVTFNVGGPTNLNVVVCPSSTTVSCPMNAMNVQLDPAAKLEAGFVGHQPNAMVTINFSETLTPPTNAGANKQVQWVQLITNDSIQLLTSDNTVCGGGPVCDAVPNGWTASNPQLDNYYPYPVFQTSPTRTNDTPSYPLGLPEPNGVGESEAERSFGAIMYLLWDPALGAANCTPANTYASINAAGQTVITQTPSSCTQSIPIPLGSVAWNTAGCAINTLSTGTGDNSTTWHLACGTPSQNSPESPIFMVSTSNISSYPTWTLATKNGTLIQTRTFSKQP